MTAAPDVPIALVGMSALFADAPDLSRFWTQLLANHCAIGDPLADWGGDDAAWLADWQGPQDMGRLYTQQGGFLRELSRFDPTAWGVMPAAVDGAEPDQFHALALVAAALADAGFLDPHRRLPTADLPTETTGLILGHGIHFHRANATGAAHGWFAPLLAQSLAAAAHRQAAPEDRRRHARAIEAQLRATLPPLTADTLPGLVPNVMTGRIANRFDLRGPNYLVDGACASSFLALSHAMDELRLGRADVMLAGGINTTTSPLVYAVFCALGALSPQGQLAPFSDGASGTLLGEGGGVVVLQRLPDALAQGRRIYAVIREVGQASDGRGKGVMAPNVAGETLAMARAYRQSGVDPATVALLEAHGTGIPLGDTTELQAIRQVFGPRARRPTVALGAVKANVGHCIPAAGMAGLLKVALALHQRVLPPTICATPRRDWAADAPVYLNTAPRPWIQGRGPRRAGVNAFGFGGINTHVLLEEWRESPFVPAPPAAAVIPPQDAPALLLASAADGATLQAHLTAALATLGAAPTADRAVLYAVAAQLREQSWAGQPPARADAHPVRLALVAGSVVEAREKLAHIAAALANNTPLTTRDGGFLRLQPPSGQLAVLFPGELAQYPGLLGDLAQRSPTVRGWFDWLDGLFADRDWPPHALLSPPPHRSPDQQAALDQAIHAMDCGSELVMTANLALFGVLTRAGLRPDAFAGHSTGENTALVASGALAFDGDDPRAGLGPLVQAMNQAFREALPASGVDAPQFLAVGGVDAAMVQAVLERFPDRLARTMNNSPHQQIVAGDAAALDAAAEAWRDAGGLCQRLPLQGGYHTARMAPLAAALEPLFLPLPWASPRGRLYSCQSAAPYPTVKDADAEGYSAAMTAQALAQYCAPVQFQPLIQQLYLDGVRLFVEIGPSATLTPLVRDTLRGQPHETLAIDDRRRGSAWGLAQALGQLFVWGRLPWADLVGVLQTPSAIAAPDSAPFLSTALPVLAVDEALWATLTASSAPETVADGAVAAISAPETVVDPVAAPENAAERSVNTVNADRAAALAGHFALMTDFLAAQERLHRAYFAPPQGASRPGRPPRRG